nr:T9SS type A sorting domain-containing protein [Bacteroidota bacterium]
PNNAEFSEWADSIKIFRQKQGITTMVVTLEEIGTNTVSGLETYFNNAYNNWDVPPAAVLLLADYGSDAANTITSPIWDGYCVSDNIFSDVTGNSMPDMIFARMTANNFEQLETMVTKFLRYEQSPPTDPGFYNHPVTALGWQTERWFQICSEVVGGFWRSMGKDPVRVNAIYQGTPGTIWSSAQNTNTVVNYFGPNGLNYIPQTPAELGGWSGGTPEMVNDALNNGAFMLQHRDHGYEQGWGEPDYSSSDINGLHNTDLSFIFSVNCLTGKYNLGSECFTEKFHRYKYNGENAGALGLIAASEVSYSFVNDVYVWGLYDNMWPDFMPAYGMPVDERGLLPAFGNAAGKYFLQQSNWPYNTGNKEVTYNLFHHHGDAFTTVYSEVPQALNVSHDQVLIAGETSFSVQADAGSFICLTLDGEIIGTAESNGFIVAIPIEPQAPQTTMVVTITKQNYYRYEQEVGVIPPTGSYVIYNSFEIDDTEGGNGNGKMDYGETIKLNMTLENVGVEQAENITATLSSTNEYITITNPGAQYGNIDPGTMVTVDGAFEITVAENIPDLMNVNCTITATDGTDSWTSYFIIQSHAPVFEIGDVIISDADGNNDGIWDPGETVDIKIETRNIGTGDAYEVSSMINSSNPFIKLNSTSFDVGMVPCSGMEYAIFNISLHPEAVVGSFIDVDFEATCAMYNIAKTLMIKVGIVLEDFETGDLSKFEWVTPGSQPWTIEETVVYEGNYGMRSGAVNTGQMCILGVEMDVMQDDIISFYRKVSTEEGAGFLRFYVDGGMQMEWSGELDWEEVTFPVPAGSHNLIWIFRKDNSGVGGEDCAWVDYIEFPSLVDEAIHAFAGWDAEVCEGNTFATMASAQNYETLLWETSGTGTFDDNSIIDAVYTPSGDDVSAGMVSLTLTAYGNGEEESSEMTLGFIAFPEQCPVPEGETSLCINPGTTSYTTIGVASANNYTWNLNPVEAGLLAYNGMEATVEWAETFVGEVSLAVMGTNDCGDGEWSVPLEVTILTIPEAAPIPVGETDVCEGEQEVQYTTDAVVNAEEYVWEISPSEAGTLSANGLMVLVNWADGFSGDASLQVMAKNICGDGAWSAPLEITITAVPDAASIPVGEAEVCEGEQEVQYTTDAIVNAESYVWELIPVEAGTLTPDGLTASVNWGEGFSGDASLQVMAHNMCGDGAPSDILTISVMPKPAVAGTITGKDKTCSGLEDTYNVGEIANAEQYEWMIMPLEAGTFSQIMNEYTITWNESWEGDASIVVRGLNECGNGEWSQEFSVLVEDCTGIGDMLNSAFALFPNPNDGSFTIELNAYENIDIMIIKTLGGIVYQENGVEINGALNHRINTTNLSDGIYYLFVRGKNLNITEKIIINR